MWRVVLIDLQPKSSLKSGMESTQVFIVNNDLAYTPRSCLWGETPSTSKTFHLRAFSKSIDSFTQSRFDWHEWLLITKRIHIFDGCPNKFGGARSGYARSEPNTEQGVRAHSTYLRRKGRSASARRFTTAMRRKIREAISHGRIALDWRQKLAVSQDRHAILRWPPLEQGGEGTLFWVAHKKVGSRGRIKLNIHKQSQRLLKSNQKHSWLHKHPCRKPQFKRTKKPRRSGAFLFV